MEYFSVIGGLILLVIAGDKLVEGSVAIAEKLHISRLIIGITIVSFGTSVPELLVGIDSALSGAPDIALGNVVGSNIANVLLVLGIPALIFPFVCQDDEAKYSLYFMVGTTFLFVFLSFLGALYIWQGIILLSLLTVFLFSSVKRARSNIKILKHDIDFTDHLLEDVDQDMAKETSLLKAVIATIIGLAGLIFGAHILVDGSVIIAQNLGISEAVIGLTIIAIGTSLPELVTSIMAAKNNHGDVAMGNIIGSNLFNILAILGVTTLLAPISIPEQFFQVDFPLLVLTTLLMVPIVLGKIAVNRITGGILTALYIFYLIFLSTQLNIV